MLLILKKGNRTETIENVYLSDGHKPTVDGIQPLSDDEDNPLFIESALWFKTYMISAIYIDCDKRQVIWFRDEVNPANVVANFQILKNSTEKPLALGPLNVKLKEIDQDFGGQKLFEDASMIYDFDPTIDELADRATEVMRALGNRQISRTAFVSEVIRIIHCYILPAICFTSWDIERLEKALERVESVLKITERNIVKKGASVDLSCSSLEKQRQRLLKVEKFHLESYIRTCNRDFLSFLLLHIEKDIVNLDSRLYIRQKEINKLRDGKASSTEAMRNTLKLLRTERDEAHRSLEKLQNVRENIKNVTKRQNHLKNVRKKHSITHNVFHEIYRELSIRLQEQKEEMHKLVIQKIKITAVREAIHNSLKELRKGGLSPTLPITSFTDGSEYSINMHGSSEKSGVWMTIDDKVKKLLSSLEREPLSVHTEGVHLILEKTEAALSEMAQFGLKIDIGDDLQGKSRLSSIGLEKDRFGDELEIPDDCDFLRSVGDASRNRRSQVKSLSASVCEQLTELSTSSIKPVISDIVSDFHNHIDKMCKVFFTYIPDIEQRHFNKLWISYEFIFCDKVLKKLMELYHAVYKGPCHILHKALVKLSLSQFVIDDNFFQKVMRQSFENLQEFEDSTVSSTTATLESQETDIDMISLSSSEISIDISKCTSEQLYTMADQECEQSPTHLHNVLDPACFKHSPSMNSLDDITGILREQDHSSLQDKHTSKSVEECYKEAIEKLLSPARAMIMQAIEGKSILEKLRHLTKAFRFMNEQLSNMDGEQSSACCDDMITITTALILDLDRDTFTDLYAVITLLLDLKPPFLAGSVHDYCLTTFFGAYQYLFDNQVLDRHELAGTATTNC